MKRIKSRNTAVEKKIAIIKDFAAKMGYTAEVFENDHCRGVELVETSDSEGNPYSWAWDVKTWREIW